jgi:Domain of unknown function (DUF4202)
VTGARERFQQAMARFDAVHAEDPEKDASGQPEELVYSKRMSAWLEKLAPDASEPLRLAVRCQHIRRWALPRSAFPPGKAGYLKWRAQEAAAHAQLAGEILQQAGYDGQTVQRVQSLVRKLGFKTDPEAQLLEDAACLVFIEYEFAEFAGKHDEPKLVDIVRKSWNKMSPRGHDAALGLKLPAPLRAIVEKALAK